jgi:hypothetical protein
MFVLGTDPKAGGSVPVEDSGVVEVGAEVSGTADVDPQAITASMVTMQNDIRNLRIIDLFQLTLSYTDAFIDSSLQP